MTLGRSEKIALQVIAAVGLIALLAIAPGMGAVLKSLGVRPKFNRNYSYSLLSRLKARGYVTFEEHNGKKYARLTDEGRKKLEQSKREMTQIRSLKKPPRWDGKWRIVTFDIPEKFRRVRDQVRRELKTVGFIQLHKSVWVFPYPCDEFISFLKADQHIGKNLLYIVADKVEYDFSLKKQFKLT